MTWVLFPLYGLRIIEPDAWLDKPLFQDATLVSRKALQNHIGPDESPLLSHGKLSEVIGSDGIAQIKLPQEQLVEIEPISYIAVRDRGDPSRNVRRATEIRALLSATLALRGHRIQSFAAAPSQIAWYIAPKEVVIDPAKPIQASIAPVFNEHVSITPLEVSQEDIRKSLEKGDPIPNNHGWYWDMHKEHPVCELFLGKISSFQKRLLNAAIQIQDAGCSMPYEVQIQGAVAAFEVILKPDSFTALRKTIEAFFPGAEQLERIKSILTMRHRITHEGTWHGDDEKTKIVAQHGLMIAWTLLDIATAFEKSGTTTNFDEYCKILVAAQELDEKLGRVDAGDPGYEAVLRKRVPNFVKFLTIRRES